MTSKAELRRNAAECQALAEQEADRTRKTMLILLRDMWTALADESECMNPQLLAREIAAVEEIHAAMLREGSMQ